MKKLTPDELDAACRIFRHVNQIAGQYYPRKTTQQIEGYVSANRWIMFPDKGIVSLKEGISIPYPNVYVSFHQDEIIDNGNGQINGFAGLTYHNVLAMDWLKQILRSPSKSFIFLDILKSFGDEWEVGVWHKTKVDHLKTVPRYSVFETTPLTVTAKDLQNTINESDNFLLYRGDPHPDDSHPVISDVTVFTVGKETEVGTFDDDIKMAFKLFMKALSLKSTI